MAHVIYMPKMSDTMEEGVIVKWLKKVGDPIHAGDILAEVETDKAVMELEAYEAGTLLHIGVEEKDAVPIDALIAIVGDKGEDYQSLLSSSSPKEDSVVSAQEAARPQAAQPAPPQAVSVSQEAQAGPAVSDRIKASPLAKRLAKEKGYALRDIHGSGDGGRIVKQDVEQYIPAVVEQGDAPADLPIYRVPVREERYQDMPLSQMRKTIARRLCDSKFSAPHFYLTVSIRMDKAMEARKRLNELSSVKISFNDMVVKACAVALGRHLQLNVSMHEDKLVRQYEHIHIGVAMAVPEGLVVPVLRYADTKSLSQVSQEIKEFARKAKEKALQPADLEGSTFSVSNLGMYGIETFTAIINPPNACILAVGAVLEQPVVEKGVLGVGNSMRVTLSCDHRVVDGAMGAKFFVGAPGFA